MHISQIIDQLKKENSETLDQSIHIVDAISLRHKEMKRKLIFKAITDGCLIVNGKVNKNVHLLVSYKDRVDFLGNKLFIAKKSIPVKNLFDQILEKLLINNFKGVSIESLTLSQQNRLAAYLLELFSKQTFSETLLNKSSHIQTVYSILKDFYKRSIAKETDKKIPEDKQLVDKLLLVRENVYDELNKIVNNLKNDLYDSEYAKLFRECRSVFSGEIFEALAQPVTEEALDFFMLIQKAVNLYKQVEKEINVAQKIKKCFDANAEYDEILRTHFLGDDKLSLGLKDIIIHFKEKCNQNAGVNDKEIAELSIEGENRSYNFSNSDLIVHAYILNNGKGIAKNVTITGSSNSLIAIPNTVVSEIVIPDSRYKIKFPIKILSPTLEKSPDISLKFSLSWHNENDAFYEIKDFGINIERQQDNLPWDEVKSRSPYDLRKIDDPTKLFGRDKLINDFKYYIDKSASVGSYVIHGQKRVGKSSIVKTLESFYSSNKNVHFVYTEVTERKGNDALYTFNEIGKHLAKQLIRDFEKKNPDFLNAIKLPSFNGSLSPLIDIVDEIQLINSEVKIIFAIDEFDELNEEFFENSNIGSVFASNIGKGLSGKRFVGVILIGSENTERKTKQGMRLLNAVKFIPVDSFPRSEFDEYCKIIKNPTEGCLFFSPEVLDIIFDYSNGNPFYTNLICDKIFNEAYDKRIPYIDQDFLTPILDDIQNSLSTKDFVHFWEDGAADDKFTNKKTFSRRSRILIGFAEASKEGNLTTWNNIRKKIPPQKNISITDNQFEETFNEFIHRKIFHVLDNNVVELRPKLFYSWLIGTGYYQIASQLEDREGLLEHIQEDEKFKISDEQLSAINNLLHGEDHSGSTRYLKVFFDQFDNNKDKSLIADLLKQIKVLKSSELIAFLKAVHKSIWPAISLTTEEYNYRKDAEVVTFEDSFEQNELFYSNIIRTQLYLSPNRKMKTRNNLNVEEDTKHLIIFDPLIDCQFYYRNEISQLLKSIDPTLVSTLKIHILTFVITNEAKDELENLLLKSFNYEFQIHCLKHYERNEISPYINKAGAINDPTLKCLTKIYGNIHENSTLIKIGEIIPYQSFPFLWCSTNQFNPLYSSKYTYDLYLKRMSFSDKLKDLYIRSESKEIELKATMSVPGVNWKKIQVLSKILKTNKASSDVINSAQNEITKLWKLDLNQNERKLASSIVQYSFAKNLCAFANTTGGELFVGIDDDFTVIGLNEGNSEEDLRRIFTELIKKFIGVEFVEYFTLNVLNITNQFSVLKIDIKECKTDIWLRCNESGNTIKEGELIFIRTEFGTEQLKPKTYKEWRDQRNAKYV